MTYSTYEYSEQDGSPIYRFLFTTGDGVDYRFTTSPTIVADSNGTYTPAPIRLGNLSQTNELAKNPLDLKFPRDNTFAQAFLGGVPEQATAVTVFRQHADDPSGDFQYYWKGRVIGAEASGDVVTISCESVFTSMKRPGVRARYQRSCRHVLYGSECRLQDYDWAVVNTVVSASGTTIVVNPDSSIEDASYYVGGTIEMSDGQVRYIVAQNGWTLTLIYKFPELEAALAADSTGEVQVTLYPGCDHTRGLCISKFDNGLNYGGFPWIPWRSPFNSGITGSVR